MALPMLIRKNIKEYEPKKDENLLKIEQIFNTDFTFECDMEKIYEIVPESSKSTIVKMIYDKYFNSLAVNMALIMYDEAIMKSFLAAVTSRKILFKVEHVDNHKYSQSLIIDGIYCLVINKDTNDLGYGVATAGYDIPELFGKANLSATSWRNPPKPFSVEMQDNIRKYQPISVEHLNKLKDFLGIQFSFAVNFEALHNKLPDSLFKKNIGEIVLDKYLSGLIVNIINFLQNHPSMKNSFLFKTEQKRIIFDVVYEYQEQTGLFFKGGIIYIHIDKTQFGFLPEQTGNNLSSLFT
jgi:hypothetical protein